MRTCVFTIVAKNYIGLGMILEQSVLRHNAEMDFRIYVADELTDGKEDLPQNVISARDVSDYTDGQWTDMAFKYDLTEFCTAVKPACFQHVFKDGYDNAIYLDPDIYVFSSLDVVLEKLNEKSVVLTPQIADIHIDYQGEHPEWAMNVNGIFNLGFCGMRRNRITEEVLAWWRMRLEDNCFTDRSVGNFTDQKWMDWMPALLGNEHLYVCRHLGMNMAPWNYFERQLFSKDGQLWVMPREGGRQEEAVPLVFLHFAGYDYNAMKQGDVVRKRINNLKEYDDIALATQQYMHTLVENEALFDRYINLSYSYAAYHDGQRIDSFHRRLYHGLTQHGRTVGNPFDNSGDSFFQALSKKGMIQKENIDRLNQRNMPDIGKKRRMIHRLFGMLYRVMGYKRYTLFVKSLYNYCRPEMHTFLIDRKDGNNQ